MKTVLISAPYMLPEMKRFRPCSEAFDLDLITPTVQNAFPRRNPCSPCRGIR